MTEKEIKEYLLAQAQEKGFNVIFFDYDSEYNMLRVLKYKRNSTIIWKEIYDVDEEYNIHYLDSSLAHFDC